MSLANPKKKKKGKIHSRLPSTGDLKEERGERWNLWINQSKYILASLEEVLVASVLKEKHQENFLSQTFEKLCTCATIRELLLIVKNIVVFLSF